MAWFFFLAFFLQGRRWSVRDQIQPYVECQNANLLFSICPCPYLLPSQSQVSGFTQRSHLLTTSYLPATFRKRDLQLYLLISAICSKYSHVGGKKSTSLSFLQLCSVTFEQLYWAWSQSQIRGIRSIICSHSPVFQSVVAHRLTFSVHVSSIVSPLVGVGCNLPF